ncbi:hypothetical protein FHY12_002620 [Xanthomonas arboricola]|uniref:hypothetical protein n=1 Tax=Xanthomonas euroxanthea TaxID=2259622 RepID=UPI001FBACA5A|nr:hypothetical protein [Xanthomonas euroxanthea]NIK40295.1 hypothetical protein [Xanthomonas euroxanthea]
MGTEPANERVVLGIHSNGGQGGLTDGHAWITVKRGDSPTEYYGLWPDNHPMVKDNGLAPTSVPEWKRDSVLMPTATTNSHRLKPKPSIKRFARMSLGN